MSEDNAIAEEATNLRVSRAGRLVAGRLLLENNPTIRVGVVMVGPVNKPQPGDNCLSCKA